MTLDSHSTPTLAMYVPFSTCQQQFSNVLSFVILQNSLSVSVRTHLHRVMQHAVKIQMTMNTSKTQTVRLKKPAGVCRASLVAARHIGWFLVAYTASSDTSSQHTSISAHYTATHPAKWPPSMFSHTCTAQIDCIEV